MRTLEQAMDYCRALAQVEGECFAVVYSRGFLEMGPYFVVHREQIPVLVAEGAKVVWEPEGVTA